MVATAHNAIAALGFISASMLSLGAMTPAQAESTPGNQAALSHEATELRSQGATGLKTFLQRHATELNPGQIPSPALREALDSLCQQKDCYTSQLYWYTDLAAAKAAAQASGKPILSLRLLGRLDQDLSCANSRFFRVALYPNAQVSQYLRDRFILHWESVRPVPKVTVDFGDGRVLERTITGNSIHYILAADGRPIEALPGLYGPQAFLQQLEQAEQAVKQYQQRPPTERNGFLQRYHRDRLVQLQTQWTKELAQLGISTKPQLTDQTVTPGQPPSATLAGQIAMTKARVESPLITNLLQDVSQNQRSLTDITDKAAWEKLATLNANQARLDANSIALLRTKKMGTATQSSVDNRSLTPVIQNFEAAMALDTVRNEYLLHSQLHQWFIRNEITQDLKRLNDQVYSSLFLTPKDDPWLGLLSQDEFSGIEKDGIRQ
ncbi:MAG TPA: hypothetical protein V6C64_01775 [Microcoleaceae cyanobacterium]